MKKLEEILNHHDRKQAFYWLTDFYQSTTDNDRAFIRANWDFGKEWEYPDQSQLTVEIGEEPEPEYRIKASLIYDSIEDFKTDFRENLISFCLIYHCALELNLDPEKLFLEVASISSEKVAKALVAFIKRKPEDKALDVFGWIKQKDEKGNTVFTFS